MNEYIASLFFIIGTLFLSRKLFIREMPKVSLFTFDGATFFILYPTTYLLSKYTPTIFPFAFVLALCATMMAIHKLKFNYSFIISTISFAIYHIVFTFCSLFVTLLFAPIYFCTSLQPSILTIFFSGFSTLLILFVVFKITIE